MRIQLMEILGNIYSKFTYNFRELKKGTGTFLKKLRKNFAGKHLNKFRNIPTQYFLKFQS